MTEDDRTLIRQVHLVARFFAHKTGYEVAPHLGKTRPYFWIVPALALAGYSEPVDRTSRELIVLYRWMYHDPEQEDACDTDSA